MSQPFLGEIRIVGFNFAPRGWARCDGQLLAISQNQALFALLGTTYGGDGRTTFALPDLRGRHAVHVGSRNQLGQKSGQEQVTVTTGQMPPHAHQARAASGPSGATTPGPTTVWGSSTTAIYATNIPAQPLTGATIGSMAPDALLSSGGSQAHPNQPPLLVLTHVIALQGIFPPRN